MNNNTLSLVDISGNHKNVIPVELNNKKHDSVPALLETNKDNVRSLLKYSTDIITILDTNGTILYESPSIENILGYTQDEIVGRNAFEFIHKDDCKRVMEFFFAGLNSKKRIENVEYRFRKSDGSYVYLESGGMNVTEKDNVTGVVVNSRDVTAKRDREVNIRKLSQAVEQSSNTVVITDVNGRIEYVNKKFEDLTGYVKEEVIGGNPNVLRNSSTTPEQHKELWTTILTGKVWEGEFQNTKKNGESYWEKIKITPIIDSDERITNFIAIKDDITEKKLKDVQLEKSLKEKELMLKEIHHRVKNNLQIVSSLLNLQAESVEDTKLKAQLTISQNRVRSMAIIHQLLYRSTDLSSITIEEYLYSISGQLLASYAELRDKITIKIDASGIKFTIETAVPFGLLINELITNSLKHGFPGNRKGIIRISLKEISPESYELIFRDNGVGIPLTLVNGHVTSFGMYLIEMLVNQLEGTIENLDSEGTSYKIQFTTGKYKKRFQVS